MITVPREGKKFSVTCVDASDEEYPTQLKVTQELLGELGAAGKPTLYVFNKCDAGIACPPSAVINTHEEKHICISAKSGEGIDALAQWILNKVRK